MTPEATPTPAGAESRALAELRHIVESGRPLLYIHSPEERRVAQLLREAAAGFFPSPVPVWTWSLTEGMRGEGCTPAGGDTLSPRAALDFVAGHQGPAIFHLVDFHEPMRDAPEIRRRLRDLYQSCFDTGKFVVVSSPVRYTPEELAREIAYVDLPLPDLTELAAFLRREGGATVTPDESVLQELARSLQGLTLDEARHAVRRAVAGGGRLDRDAVPALLEEKRIVINRSGLIEVVPLDAGIEHIGGLGAVKKWLLERRKLFLQRDDLAAEVVPKGLLVMGISGCGKSLCVKSVATCFDLPLYRIDMTSVFSGRHGSAETAFVSACRMLGQVSPAVVWFDEIEMAITTHANDATGELNRIFAFFLTWMQEKPRGLFVAATANRIDLLPAEMIRKGRFDEVFFVDLPTPEERIETFEIHLKKRGVDSSGFDLERLARFTEGWSGAEVEQCVVSALTTARLAGRPPEADDLLNAASQGVPLSKTMKEQIDHIRNWAYDRAVNARPDQLGGY